MNKFGEAVSNITGIIGGVAEEAVYHMSRGFSYAAHSAIPHIKNLMKRSRVPIVPAGVVCGLGLVTTAFNASAANIVATTTGVAGVALAITVSKIAGDRISEATQTRGEYLPKYQQMGCKIIGAGLFVAFTTATGYQVATRTQQHFSDQAANRISIQKSERGGCTIVLTGYPQTAEVLFGDCTVR